jgi:hypothetical protein
MGGVNIAEQSPLVLRGSYLHIYSGTMHPISVLWTKAVHAGPVSLCYYIMQQVILENLKENFTTGLNNVTGRLVIQAYYY